MSQEAVYLEEKLRMLPPDLQQEVLDFVEFLLRKWEQKPRSRPQFDWAGALQDLKDQYTSVDLQHQIAKWRVGES